MIQLKSLFFLSFLTGGGYAFSAPIKPTEKQIPQEKSTEVAPPVATPAFIRSSSLLKKFDDLFNEPFHKFEDFFSVTGMDIMPMFEEIDRQQDTLFQTTRISPSYEITENENEVRVVLDVPGIEAEDMSLEIEAQGRMIHLTGKKVKKDGDSVSESRFDKRFTVDTRIDANRVTANLSNGVLTIIAPKQEIEKRDVHKIYITEG